MTAGNLWYKFLLTEISVVISHEVAQGFIKLGFKTSKYRAGMVSGDNLLFCLTVLKQKKILFISGLKLFFCYRYYKRHYYCQKSVLHFYMLNVNGDRMCYLNS